MANATCGPIYVLDTTGTIQPCGRMYLIHSIAWTDHTTGVGRPRAALEDMQGRTIYYEIGTCSKFNAYTKPLTANGLVLRLLDTGRLYIQVET